MKRFSDFGINTLDNRNVFVVPVISIEEVINCEIEVLDFEANVTTKHGPGRYIVKIKYAGAECKFFTSATPIKEALDKISKDNFPFQTVIKVQRFGAGAGKTFYFT
jgi:hypothetical protein